MTYVRILSYIFRDITQKVLLVKTRPLFQVNKTIF